MQTNVSSYLDVFMNAFPFTSYRTNNESLCASLISMPSLTFSLAFWRWSHYQSVRLKKEMKQAMVSLQTIEKH